MTRYHVVASLFASLVVLVVAVSGVSAAPLPTSGLQAQFRADAGVVTAGPNVTQWNDQAALNGLNNATATGTNPTLGSAAIGYHASFPIVQFGAGTPLAFTLPAANTFAGVTVLTVSSRTAPNNQYETLLSTGFTGGGVRWGFGMGTDATYGYGWAGPTSSLSLGNGSSIANDTWHLISWAYDKTSWKVRNEYPTPLAVTTVADTSFFTGNWTGVIGTESTASPATYHFSGQIAELLIYDHQLSPAEYQDALNYLQERFFVAPVPEPSTLALLGLGMGGLAAKARRRRAAA